MESTDMSLWKRRVLVEGERAFESKVFAMRWFNTRLSAFDGKTPVELVEAGRGEVVLTYLRSISSGFVG